MAKTNKKNALLIPTIFIFIILIIVVIYFGIFSRRNENELKLSNANDTLSEIATDAGLVDKSDGSFYITLYVTAGVILISGIVVFLFVRKKADE